MATTGNTQVMEVAATRALRQPEFQSRWLEQKGKTGCRASLCCLFCATKLPGHPSQHKSTMTGLGAIVPFQMSLNSASLLTDHIFPPFFCFSKKRTSEPSAPSGGSSMESLQIVFSVCSCMGLGIISAWGELSDPHASLTRKQSSWGTMGESSESPHKERGREL